MKTPLHEKITLSLFLAGLVLSCIGAFTEKIILVPIGLAIAIISIVVNKKIAKNYVNPVLQELGKYPEYDKENNTLRIYKCTEMLRTMNYIKIEPVKHFSTQVTPTKVHVGAVTVGGVTTGGVYTTGGQKVVNTTDDSNYYRLVYNRSVDGMKTKIPEIKRIFITQEMYEKAKESKIKNYLSETNGEYSIVVVKDAKLEYWEAQIVVKSFEFSSVAQDMINRGYPSREKCETIVDWLCTPNE